MGVAGKTAKEWLAIMLQTYQWRSHLPYFRNSTKRLSKKRKGYFVDTGFACNLIGIPSLADLAKSDYAGHLFESWIVNSLYQQVAVIPARCAFIIGVQALVLKLILYKYNGQLYPIEVKIVILLALVIHASYSCI